VRLGVRLSRNTAARPNHPAEAVKQKSASFRRLVYPLAYIYLSLPGFLSAGTFGLTLSENEFLYALLLLSTSSVRTVPIGVVGELNRGDPFYWRQLMAGAPLGSIPVDLIYSFFVKYYVACLTAGAVKG
jgi:multiple sugar transport system permease protein